MGKNQTDFQDAPNGLQVYRLVAEPEDLFARLSDLSQNAQEGIGRTAS